MSGGQHPGRAGRGARNMLPGLGLRARERMVLIGILAILLVGMISRHFYLNRERGGAYDAPVTKNARPGR